jgi:hypothetical protein
MSDDPEEIERSVRQLASAIMQLLAGNEQAIAEAALSCAVAAMLVASTERHRRDAALAGHSTMVLDLIDDEEFVQYVNNNTTAITPQGHA